MNKTITSRGKSFKSTDIASQKCGVQVMFGDDYAGHVMASLTYVADMLSEQGFRLTGLMGNVVRFER